MNSLRVLPDQVDLVVAGAGTAGAATAAHAAERGLSVLCIERSPLDKAGARWVNGVARDAFDHAGISQPSGDELRGLDTRFHMFAKRGPQRVVMEDHGVLEVDMRLLVKRLQARCQEAGVTLAGDVSVHDVEGHVVSTSAGAVRAEFIVDASGLGGLNLLGVPKPPKSDLCAAAQAVHKVADPDAAQRFLDRHDARPGETICFTGIAGGYSILNVAVHGEEVGILTGSIPADGHPSGKRILDEFVASTDWIGVRCFGGNRAIPLGGLPRELTHGNVAAVGDAARQVFSAHGSGIGPGMAAGRMLADCLAETGHVRDYSVRWMRRFGGLFAGYDILRRVSQSLSGDQIEILIAEGVLDAPSVAAGLGQRLPSPSAERALAMPRQLARCGPVGARMAAAGARVGAVAALYAAYPKRGSRRGWAALVRAAMRN